MQSKNQMKTKALQYLLTYGFSVFPVKQDKTPYIASWKKYQTQLPTEEEVNNWWASYPSANIGIITGKISGITVVDLDLYKDKANKNIDDSKKINSKKTLQDILLDINKKFPKTYTVKTGNNGLQLYYKYTEGLSISANAYPDLPNVDIRSDGGYVVAPPSMTNYIDKNTKETKGGLYEVIDDSAFADFPTSLFKQKKAKKKLVDLTNISTGSRNSSMASVIGTIILPLEESKFLTDGWNAVQAINATYNPPLPMDELTTTFNSIVEKERQRRAEKYKNIEELDLLYVIKNKEKVFILNTENICRVLVGHSYFKGRFRIDNFKCLLEIKPHKTDKWRALEDADSIDIQTSISILFPSFAKVGKEMVYDAIVKVSKDNAIDSASDYIRSLVWDGSPRLKNWLREVYGAPDDKYHTAVASNWFKGLVKRITNPGCKFDYVLVLEGQQGTGKSTSLSVLGGSMDQNWHVETTMSTDTKDFFMQFEGKAIIEFSEGETLSRTEVKRLKAIITMQSDKYRPPYERTSKDFPRRCVFAMTTNQTEYLKDETGNRRWLPVAVLLKKCNVDWLRDNRDQLLAEAYHRLSVLKETVYEFPEEETVAQQQQRRIHDANEDLISDWYWNKLTILQRKEGITIHQVYRDVLCGGFPTRSINKHEEMSISSTLKDAMRLEKRQVMRDYVRIVRWYNPKEEVDELGNSIVQSETDKLVVEIYDKW